MFLKLGESDWRHKKRHWQPVKTTRFNESQKVNNMNRCLVLFFLCVQICYAQKIYFADTGSSIWSYYSETLKKQGSKSTIWDEVVFKEPRRTANGKNYYTMKTLKIFDCSNNKFGIISFAMYDEKGNVVSSDDSPISLTEMQNVIPGTMIEKVYEFSCR